jgi:hypothetical protein
LGCFALIDSAHVSGDLHLKNPSAAKSLSRLEMFEGVARLHTG